MTHHNPLQQHDHNTIRRQTEGDREIRQRQRRRKRRRQDRTRVSSTIHLRFSFRVQLKYSFFIFFELITYAVTVSKKIRISYAATVFSQEPFLQKYSVGGYTPQPGEWVGMKKTRREDCGHKTKVKNINPRGHESQPRMERIMHLVAEWISLTEM